MNSLIVQHFFKKSVLTSLKMNLSWPPRIGWTTPSGFYEKQLLVAVLGTPTVPSNGVSNTKIEFLRF